MIAEDGVYKNIDKVENVGVRGEHIGSCPLIYSLVVIGERDMGFSLSWITVKDCKLSQVIQGLGLEATEKVEIFPESHISSAALMLR
ncbi:hypothetical protein MO867_07675 [Microbulbifer sp. OS29]|uniref:Uncharacterized protein n=1 Tax=Microbulbifer okhotskensis TaxID=2926617 RepID=A0A9X2ER90_9GAMM|nr:hypothetical protein [Microbulbifer okhotskensis]MCO1334221.1 hypothetical protein [Microbulbifer okhotskensis]